MSKELETKARILELLKAKDMTVVELSVELGLSRATVRQHISELRAVGAIEEIPDAYFRKHISYKAKRSEGKTILKDSKLRWIAGNILFEEGKLAEALEEFTAAASIDPKYADAYFNKALTESMMGNLDSAVKDLEKVLKLQPKSHDAPLLMGDIQEKRGKLADAKRWYEKALENYPYYPEAKAKLHKLELKSNRT